MDKENLKFHIDKNDYFGTLATVLDLVRQNLNPYTQKEERKILKDKVNELMHLQDKYKIIKKH